MDEVPLVYNPAAGAGRGERLARKTTRILAAGGVRARPIATRAAEGVGPQVQRLVRDGAARILVLGGDGTHGEAADALIQAGAGPTCALGLLPSGTGNDLLHAFGLARLEDAVGRVLRAQPRAIDVGLATWDRGSRHFLSLFGTGFLADVTDLANRRLKALGRAAYTAAAPLALARLRATPTMLRLDGREVAGDLPLVAVCNTAYAGGRMRFAPAADPTDGLLDVLAIRGARAARVLRLLPLLRKGAHIAEPDIVVDRARRIEISTQAEQGLLADGETFGATPVTIEALPGALRAYL